MKTVIIDGYEYEYEQIPTTQEDNAGGIVDRFLLYLDGSYVARLAKWNTGQYAFRIKPGEVFVLEESQVIFQLNHDIRRV